MQFEYKGIEIKTGIHVKIEVKNGECTLTAHDVDPVLTEAGLYGWELVNITQEEFQSYTTGSKTITTYAWLKREIEQKAAE
jgi:hypothetical protein